MTGALLVLRLCIAAGALLTMCGATLAWNSISFTKRVAGIVIALIGALVTAAATGAPQTALIAGVGVLLCYAAIGASMLVRLQESYGSTELADIDAADFRRGLGAGGVIENLVALARLHAPLLLIVTPVVTAAGAFVVTTARAAWVVALAGAIIAAIIAVDLAARTLLGAGQPGTQEGLAIEFDAVGVYVAAVIAIGSVLTTFAAGAFLEEFGPKGAAPALAAGLIVSAGWAGAVLARDLIGMFVGVETAWLAAAGLVSLGANRERSALNGAARMLAAGGAAAALMLVGAAFVTASIGSIDIAALAENWRGAPSAAAAGVALIILALSVRAAVAPLHAWAPIAMARGSNYATLIVGAVGVVGAFGVIARVTVFAVAAPNLGNGASLALSVLGAGSALIGSIQAIGASNLRRLAAYAGAAQGGCILLAVSLGSPAGFEAAFIQLFALMASMFALIGGAAVAGGETLRALDGLGRRAPIASAAIAAGALSLMGAPLSIGFLGRWRLIEAALGVGGWWMAAVVIAASLAGVFYGGRIIERLYFRRASAATGASRDFWRFALTPALVFAIAAVALGLQPIVLLRAAESASMLVLGRAG